MFDTPDNLLGGTPPPPDLNGLPVTGNSPTPAPEPQVQPPDKHTLIGRAASHIAQTLQGEEIKGYEPDPETGTLKPVVGPRKPGQIFRDIILGALIGGEASSLAPHDTSPLGGALIGGAASIRGLNELQQQRAAQLKTEATEDEEGLKQRKDKELQEAQNAVHTISSLDFDRFSNHYSNQQISAHNNSAEYFKQSILNNGGQLAQIPGTDGQNINGKIDNGGTLMEKYNKSPEAVMRAPDGFHRIHVASIDTNGLENRNGTWFDPKTGKEIDLSDRTTHYLVDMPAANWGKTVPVTGGDINTLAGYNVVPTSQEKKTFKTSFASILGLRTKSLQGLADARRDLMAPPNNDQQSDQWAAQIAGIAHDPDATDDDKHWAASKAPIIEGYNKLRQQRDALKAQTESDAAVAKEKALGPVQAANAVSKQNAMAPGEVRIAGQKKAAELGAEQKVVGADNGPTGSDYLATLPQAERSNLQAYYDGRLEVTASFARSKEGLRILKELTTAYPDFDASKAPAYFKMRQDFTTGKTADGITALSTAVAHLERAHDHTSALATIPGVRSIAQLAGNQNATGLNSDKEAVAMELGKAYKNGVVTNDEAKSWKALLDASTPAELRGNINELAQLLTGRLQSLKDRWDNGKPSDGVKPVRIISPNVARVFKKITGNDLESDSASSQNEQTPSAEHPFFSKFGGKADH